MTESPRRPRLLLRAIVILLVVMGILECGLRLNDWYTKRASPPPTTNKRGAEDELRLLCIGDAMTALGGAHSYPQQLEDILRLRFPGKKVRVYNGAMLTADSAEILSALAAQLNRYQPHMVISMMGGYDNENTKFFPFPHAPEPRPRVLVFGFLARVSARSVTGIMSLLHGMRNAAAAGQQSLTAWMATLQEYRPSRYSERIYKASAASYRPDFQPRQATAAATAGWNAYQAGRWPEAEQRFQEALALNADDEHTVSGYAWSLLKQKKISAAEHAFNQLISRHNNSFRGRHGLAWVLKEQGRSKEAIVAFQTLQQHYPKMLEAQTGLAWCYIDVGEYGKADQLFQTVVFVDSGNADAWYGLGMALQHQQQYAAAEQALRQSLLFLSRDVRVLSALAWNSLYQFHPRRARRLFSLVLSKQPTFWEAWMGYGLAQKELGNAIKAEQALLAVLRHDPQSLRPYILLGWLYVERGDYRRALDFFNAARQLSPMQAEAGIGIAVSLMRQTGYAAAEKELLRLRKTQPRNRMVYTLLAECSRRRGRSAQAGRWQRLRDSLPTEDVDTLLLEATFALEQREYRAADRTFQQCLVLNPRHSRALAGRGWCALAEKEFAAAQTFFSQAMMNNNEDVHIRNGFAWACLRTGNIRQAMDMFSAVLSAQPDNVNALNGLADCYFGWQNYHEARTLYQRLRAHTPQAWEAYAGLAHCDFMQGNYQQAISWYERAAALNPDYPLLWIRRAISLRGLELYTEANTVLAAAWERFPEQRDIPGLIGWDFDSPRAKQNMEAQMRLLAGNHNNLYAYFWLGREAVLRKDFLTARQWYEQARDRQPESLSPWLALLSLYREMGMDDLYHQLEQQLQQPGGPTTLPAVTAHNYHALAAYLSGQDIPLVVLSYPNRGMRQLQHRLAVSSAQLYFVNFISSFSDVISRFGFTTVFCNAFGGSYGHCTRIGNAVMAKQIADHIQPFISRFYEYSGTVVAHQAVDRI